MSSAVYALELKGRVAQPPQKANVAEHKSVWQVKPAITPEAEQELARDAAREAALVNAVKRGDLAAFEPLVEAHHTRVYQLAYRMLGNEQEAQDAAQDAFLQALTRINSFDTRYRFKSWVMAIANNACIDRLRRRRIEPSDFADHVPADEPDAEFDVMSNDPQPDVIAAQHERQRVVMSLLKELSPEDRSMITMFYWGDMSYEEIAASTRNTVSAVKSRLFRARRALAELPLAAKLLDEK
ncbi:MAG TPA: sigma-70 family RNA polymerase sigma factor [Thermoflexales bacterium]|nr:sigma-70 family RNA polymerase sigma factor [Thermoflexales bacterium]HQW33812.1 sigma-70 family RNA polymerase sigma factor [Thermoflexales bacterium]HQX76055.1 sigma-70 family RNA polymerase sigma factor [Thermoflexales bacterium]HRA00049.1 sigma-70 family RNA polymerase sigma factor [Thermoflexales bacterium]